jgi:hypothetical protein
MADRTSIFQEIPDADMNEAYPQANSQNGGSPGRSSTLQEGVGLALPRRLLHLTIVLRMSVLHGTQKYAVSDDNDSNLLSISPGRRPRRTRWKQPRVR